MIIIVYIENNYQLIYLLSNVDLLEENKVIHYELNSFLFKYLWKINSETIEKSLINQNTKHLDFISKNSIIFKNIEIKNLKKIKCTYSIDENFTPRIIVIYF